MLVTNKAYLAFLEGLNDVDKARLLHGNWDARPKGANYLDFSWLTEVSKVPEGLVYARGYDLAATERSQVNKHPDATVSIKMGTKDGYYYIFGSYHQDFYDPVDQVYGRMCKRVGDRDMTILAQARMDGTECAIVLPVDPGAAGKQVYNEMSKFLTSNGFRVKKDPVAGNKSKLTRFLPFATAAENGLVRIVRNSFDEKTYQWLKKELEAFNGERSSSTRHDDFPDAIATIFNFLCTTKTHRAVNIPSVDAPTLLHQHRNRIR